MSDSDSGNERRFPYDVPLSSQEACDIVIEAQDRHNLAPPNQRILISVRVNDRIERRRERQQRYRERNREVIRERNRNYYSQKRRNAQITISDSGYDNIEAITDEEISNNPEARKKKLRKERNRRYREEHREILKQRNKDYRQRKKNTQKGSGDFQLPKRQSQEKRVGPPLSNLMERFENPEWNTKEGPSTNAEEVINPDIDELANFDAYSNYNRDKSAHKFFMENFKNNQFGHACSVCERHFFLR